MTRLTVLLLVLTTATGFGWWALAGPELETEPYAAPVAASPATRPVVPPNLIPESAPLPDKYEALIRRNLFAVGRMASLPRYRQGQEPPRPEDQFVLRGIMHQSGQFTALIEDLSTQQIRRLQAGEALATGVLSEVSFDGLRYRCQGNDTRVVVGQKLSGSMAVDPVVAKPARSRSDGNDRDNDRSRERSRSEDKASS